MTPIEALALILVILVVAYIYYRLLEALTLHIIVGIIDEWHKIFRR